MSEAAGRVGYENSEAESRELAIIVLRGCAWLGEDGWL